MSSSAGARSEIAGIASAFASHEKCIVLRGRRSFKTVALAAQVAADRPRALADGASQIVVVHSPEAYSKFCALLESMRVDAAVVVGVPRLGDRPIYLYLDEPHMLPLIDFSALAAAKVVRAIGTPVPSSPCSRTLQLLRVVSDNPALPAWA